jgi:hypothetical protein
MKKSTLALAAILTSNLAHGSALVQKDDVNGVLKFMTQINYVGPLATDEIARASSTEISNMWNESQAHVNYKGRDYKIQFVIGYSVNAPLTRYVRTNSCGDNLVNIDKLSRPGDRSFYGLYGRGGTFYTSDDLGHSTTAAHEFGHGLGLDHNGGYQLDAQVPGIMFARGTPVKKMFQWDQNAEPGMPGGSINPKYRHVRAEDVAAIDLNSLSFNKGFACLGEGVATPVKLSNVIPQLPAVPSIQMESGQLGSLHLFSDELNAEANDAI